MLGRISGTGVGYLLGLMKPAARPAGGQAASADDTVGGTARRQRAQEAAEALNTLRTAVSNQKQQRKAAAKAKVDRLKKELETLRLMSGGDPKAIARRAAQIARELASAAKEYASSGGSGMAAGGPSAQSSGNSGASAQADAARQDEAAPQDQAENTAVAAEAEAVATEAGDELQTAKPEKGHVFGAENTVATEEEARQLAADTFRQMAADVARRGGEKKEDSEFAAELRRLMAVAKSIVAQARRRAEQSGDEDELERLVKRVEQAEADMEDGFSAAPELPVPSVDVLV